MKIKVPTFMFLLLVIGCNQKNNPCKYIDSDGSLLKLSVLNHYEEKVQKTFANANIQISTNSRLVNERLDTLLAYHYKVDLITNYFNPSMSQYSLATLEIYCDSIARISSKSISRFEFHKLLEPLE